MLNDFLEKTLEEIIYENRNIIHFRGFYKLKENVYRQVILPSGKKIDILSFEINNGVLLCDIYELKREVINADAICQAFNYYTELNCITKSYFSAFNATIIMVGRKYEPVSIIDSLPIPIEVYGYEYYMDGIKFKKLHNPYVYAEPHDSFSCGIWAFGYHGLSFTHQTKSISFHSVFQDYSKSKPEFGNKVKSYIKNYVRLPKIEIENYLIEYKIEPKKYITTEIFPEQPAWTHEFAKSIPDPTSILEDCELDLCDFEDEELENDFSDYESDDCDYESCYEEHNFNVFEPEYEKSLYINSLTIEPLKD